MQRKLSARTLTLCGTQLIVLTALAVLAAAMGGSILAATAVRAADGDPNPGAVALGVAVDGDDPALVTDFEADAGRAVDVVRVFKLWDDPFPTVDDLQLLDSRDLVLSIKAATDEGPIAWADIAAATPGDPLHDDMLAWATALSPYQDQLHLTFHHEPEANPNIANGTNSDFISAWQAFMGVLADQGVEPITRAWIMTDYSFHLPEGDRRHAPDWYPGDEWVDAIAADVYNWYECRPDRTADWTPAAINIEPLRQFGLAHPDKQLMLTEVGSVEDPADPGRKALWLNELATLMAEPAYSQFTLVAWFDLVHPEPGTDCDWRIQTSPQATDAFAALAATPAFGGDGPAADPYCTFQRSGADMTIVWPADPGSHVLRRSGAWLVTPADGVTSHVDVGSPAGSTYALRSWVDGIVVERECTEIEGDDPPDPEPTECNATMENGSVRLDWTDDGGLHVVRRNGSWLATVGEGISTYLDTTPGPAAAYTIRSWTDEGPVDLPCDGPPPPDTPWCVASVEGDSVRLDWTDGGGVHIVRRNGAWLATPGEAVSTYLDTSPGGATDYSIRTWLPEGRVDHGCEWAQP